MKEIYEFYDKAAEISSSTREAVVALELAQKKVKEALIVIKGMRGQGDSMMTSTATINDIHRTLLFLELSLCHISGLTHSEVITELLLITNYELEEKDSTPPWLW